MKLFCLVLILGMSLLANGQAATPNPLSMNAANVPGITELQKMTARFAPTELKVDTSQLSPGDQKALVKLVQAAHLIDDIFLNQI